MRALAIVLVVSMLLAGCATSPEPAASPPPSPLRESNFSWSPAFPEVGQDVRFEASVRSSAAGDSLQGVLWRIEGVRHDGAEVTHTFQTAGEHSVAMTVLSVQGGAYTVERTVTVLPAAPDPTSETPPSHQAPPSDIAAPTILVQQERHVVSFAFTWEATAQNVYWDFGDGRSSTEHTPTHSYRTAGEFTVLLRVAAGDAVQEATTAVRIDEAPSEPTVIVGVPDSGINPYHEIYYRPERTEHPCTYLDVPCTIKELPLSVGKHGAYGEALAADRALWDGLQPQTWYWIPQTVFIAVRCEGTTSASDTSGGGICILDDTSMHGTGTTSSVLTENPDALIVFVEGNAGGAAVIHESGLPVDIISYSWGAAVPLVGVQVLGYEYDPFFVAASGNEGAFPVVLDGTKSSTTIITVGGADGASRTEPGYSSWKTMDFVSEYCRPTAQTQSLDEVRERYCGTSFSAPTFAGALSKVILEVRRHSGYLGHTSNGVVDPILGITKSDVREALNRTASFHPESPFASEPEAVPLLEQAPFYQWGWGYFARNEAGATVDCLLDGICPERDAATTAYMETLWTYRQTAG